MTQNQVDALSSLAYSTGGYTFLTSSIPLLLEEGRAEFVPDVIRQFVYGGGVRLPGLIPRRDAEAGLFGR